MFRLTREVRFALNPPDDPQLALAPTNSFAGFPSLTGIAPHVALRVTLSGPLDPSSFYLCNIREIDHAVRRSIVGALTPATLIDPAASYETLHGSFKPHRVESVSLLLSPYLMTTQLAEEYGMFTRLSQMFEFSASHRLNNAALSTEDNVRTYGKCNNASGHGHNYQLQVTLRGKPNRNGLLVDVPAFERIVAERVIARLDHRNLNLDVPEFRELIPTVENIAQVIYRMLIEQFRSIGAELASVTVWETTKTWCEYSE